MTASDHDPSIDAEPHLRQQFFRPDVSEQTADLRDAATRPVPLDEQAEHSVWDEPGLSTDLSGPPPDDALTYARWLDFRLRRTSPLDSWLTTLVIVVLAGPAAILGALFTGDNGQTVAGIAMITILGPTVEEMLKAALALWVIEKRPYRFRSSLQIGLCLVASGLVFAIVENLLYLYVYIDDPSPELIQWRWTVCVALHSGCSLIAGLGLMRIWRATLQRRTRPQLTLGAPYMVTAIVIHGVYNAFCVALDVTGFQF